MPYELLPLPAEGERVDALGRTGEHLCEGTVLRVRQPGKGELCNAVTLVIPKPFIHRVRHLRRRPA